MADLLIQPTRQDMRIIPADPTRPMHIQQYAGAVVPTSSPPMFQPINPAWDWGMAYSPNVRHFQQSIYDVLQELARRLDNIIYAFSLEREPDYGYMEQACSVASSAPDMTFTETEAQAYAGLSDFTYTIDSDY